MDIDLSAPRATGQLLSVVQTREPSTPAVLQAEPRYAEVQSGWTTAPRPDALLRGEPVAWLRRLGQNCDAFIATYESDPGQVVFAITLAWNELQRQRTGATPIPGSEPEVWVPTKEGGIRMREPEASFAARLADGLYRHCLLVTGRAATLTPPVLVPPALVLPALGPSSPALAAKSAPPSGQFTGRLNRPASSVSVQVTKPTGQMSATGSGLAGVVLGFALGFLAGRTRR